MGSSCCAAGVSGCSIIAGFGVAGVTRLSSHWLFAHPDSSAYHSPAPSAPLPAPSGLPQSLPTRDVPAPSNTCEVLLFSHENKITRPAGLAHILPPIPLRTAHPPPQQHFGTLDLPHPPPPPQCFAAAPPSRAPALPLKLCLYLPLPLIPSAPHSPSALSGVGFPHAWSPDLRASFFFPVGGPVRRSCGGVEGVMKHSS